MSEHTEGPWRIGWGSGLTGPRCGPMAYLNCECGLDPCTCMKGRIVRLPISHGEYPVAWLLCSGGRKSDLLPDAHLIAAAPELLHALERFVAGIEAHADDAMRKTLSYHMGNMKAAIAKAKGK